MSSGDNEYQGKADTVVFSPVRDLREAIERGRADVEAWSRGRDGHRGVGPAGEYIAEMTRSRSTTCDFLKASDTRLRLVAVTLVADYWPPWRGFAAQTLRLAFEDQEPSIRGAALVAIRLLREYIVDPAGHLRTLLEGIFPMTSAEVAATGHMADEIEAFIETKINNISQKLAGSFLPVMLESRASAESFLHHSDPQLRCAAIFIIRRRWGATAELAQACEDMLFSDPSLKVQLQAVAALDGCYFGTDDPRIEATLAKLVCDDSQPDDLRRSAYVALFNISGMPVDAVLRAASPALRLPQDVDWAFVKGFCRGSSGDTIPNY